jgi:hypothetical protein
LSFRCVTVDKLDAITICPKFILFQLANGIIVDLKTILGDMRKGEAEFAEGVNPELRSTIEKAIGELQLRLPVLNLTLSNSC